MPTLRLRVQLRDVHPPVVRVVDVPGEATLGEVHLMLQVALGWTEAHLHQFEVGDVLYGVPDPDGPEVSDESTTRLSDLPTHWVYVYDFGDGWTHDVELLGDGADGPGCIAGEGDCPPEDCGGWPGYDELREAMADPDRDDLDDVAAEIRPFDRERADRLVRQVVGRVPDGVRMLLDVIGGGVTPTAAGRLPRALVQEVQSRRPEWAIEDKPARFEEHLPPLQGLHEVLYSTGLLRKSHGKLVPLRAAGNDREVLRRLRRWFAPESFEGFLAELTVATLMSEGPKPIGMLAAGLVPMFTPWATVDGRRLGKDDIRGAMAELGGVLAGLGQIENADLRTWGAGPEAGWLLPRSALIADLWSAG
jgi:hypothetical protein